MSVADGFNLWLGRALVELLLVGVCMVLFVGFIAFMLWLENRR